MDHPGRRVTGDGDTQAIGAMEVVPGVDAGMGPNHSWEKAFGLQRCPICLGLRVDGEENALGSCEAFPSFLQPLVEDARGHHIAVLQPLQEGVRRTLLCLRCGGYCSKNLQAKVQAPCRGITARDARSWRRLTNGRRPHSGQIGAFGVPSPAFIMAGGMES